MLKTDLAKPVLLKNYTKPDYYASEIELHFALDHKQTTVTSTTRYIRKHGTKKTPLKLDGDGLEFVSAKLDGKPLNKSEFKVSPDGFTLKSPPKTFALEIVTSINPEANTALSGLYRSGGNYCTQCEAEGFRRITYFQDRPDILSVYTVRIEADRADCPLLLSNGNPIKKGRLANNRHFAVWHDPHPKPSYLFALVGGDLDGLHKNFKTRDGRKVRLGIYVEKGKVDRADYAMDALIRSMKWDEEKFNCIYDLDVFNIVAVSDFNMGAMENKGLNIFNDKFVLADQQSASDSDFARIEAIIAHEYFHNWTGNRITCRDWFQLCLKEGLTVFRDQEFSSDMRSRDVKRIEDVVQLRAHQFPEDGGPLAHPVRPTAYREINNFYTATIYEKGAELVRMLLTLLGEKKFAAGMKRYFQKHDGDAATIEDFIRCFEVAGRTDLSQFFLWYQQAGTPVVLVSTSYDRMKKQFTMEFEQTLSPTPSQPRKKPMHIPIRIGLIDSSNGEEIFKLRCESEHFKNGVFELKQAKQKLVFSRVENRPIPSINRGFSAPVDIDYRQSDSDLIFMAANDRDSFNRWQAFRTIASRQIIAAMRALHAKKKPNWNEHLIDAAVKIADDHSLDPAYRAMMLTLPSEAELAQLVGRHINPDAVMTARNGLQNKLGEALEESRDARLAALQINQDYSPNAEQSGKRALANLFLAYGLYANSENAEKRLVKKYKTANNMTDREFAFRMILREMPNSADFDKAINGFYRKYKNDQIILDKWFMAQATLPGKTALKTVQALVKHKDFKWTNPNRVRAVIGAFASANPTGFNRVDGAGYRFVSNSIAKLDRINPQVAARMLTAFRSWRSLEITRRKLAEKSLKELKSKNTLSKDVSEILDRMLS